MSTRTAIAGVAFAGLAGLFLIAVVAPALERAPSDTDMPSDPFESNEPHVVDCVADWVNRTSDGRVIEADIYCEVGDDNFDARDVSRSPYVWSTTGDIGDTAIVDVYLGTETTGSCSIWVDGELLETAPVVQNIDEGEGPNETDLVTWYCGIEVTIG